MATFPDLTYSDTNYSFSVTPEVMRTEYASSNTRQRYLRKKRDDLFSVAIEADNTDLETFETFVLTTLNNGADTFTGPFYTSDSEQTGTLEIIDGRYNVQYLTDGFWRISYQFEVKGRALDDESNIYALVNEHSGFQGFYDIMQATEDAVNYNNL